MLRDYLLKDDLQRKYLEELKNRILAERNIMAWGTGRGAKKLLQFMNQIGWSGKLQFIDTNRDKCGVLYAGYRTVSPETFFKEEYDRDALILITCADVGGVQQSINSFVKHEKVLVSDLTSIDLDVSETWFDYIWQNIENFTEAYDMLADDKSKEVFVGLLNYRISRDVEYIKNYVDDENKQYFEDSLFSIDNLALVDCGAYTGDTIEKFIERTSACYKKIYAFEPDSLIYKKLEDNISMNGWEHIDAYNMGNYKEKAVLCFESDGNGTAMSNHIAVGGNVQVAVDALDNVIDEQIDLIKMDIEGAEYEALLGAKRLIQQYSPILAICIYHKPDDYYTLLKLIYSINPNYKFYVRQYAYNDNETILYAVRKSKL